MEGQHEGYWNVKDVAEYLKVRPSTLYTMVEEKRVPHYRVGRQIRFRKADIDRWMEEQKEEVIDTKAEAKKVIKSLQKKSDVDIDRIVAKAIEQTKGKGYTSDQEKPGRVKGLEREVTHGAI